MKKLLLAVFALAAIAASAQRTKKDLKVELLSPVDGGTVTNETKLDLQVKITNLGPDSVQVSDSVLLVFLLNNNQMSFTINNVSRNFFLFHSKIDKDSSVYFTLPNVTIPINNPSTPGQNLCAVVVVSDSINLDSASANNVDCNTVTFAWPTGTKETVAAAGTKVYPNPASDVLHIEVGAFENKTFNVIDLTGKAVASQALTGSKTDLNVSTFAKGVYFYEIRNAEGITEKSGKFNVN